jgi:ribosomal protein L37AE/L43A
MTSINDKMGLRRAGKRTMMKLPPDRELRNQLTAARCAQCGHTGAILSRVHVGWFKCSWCDHAWNPNGT